MNKKFLSAILFGALMVTSTGTFVSCKDYDDDIENLQGQISANASAIAELKSLIQNGDYVTNVAVSGQNLVVTFKNAGPQNLALPECDDEVGSYVKVEGGVLYIDGKATDIKVAEDAPVSEFKPAVAIVDGEWAVLNAEGEYDSTGILATSTTAVQNADKSWTLTIKDAEGNAQEVKIPSAASMITSIEVAPNVHNDDFLRDDNDPDYDYYGNHVKPDYAKLRVTSATFIKPSTWAGKRELPSNKSRVYAINGLNVRINPVSAPAQDVEFYLTNTKNHTLSNLKLYASATQDSNGGAINIGGINGRAAVTGNGLWTLGQSQFVLTEEAAKAFDKDLSDNGAINEDATYTYTDEDENEVEITDPMLKATAYAVNANMVTRSNYNVALTRKAAGELTSVYTYAGYNEASLYSTKDETEDNEGSITVNVGQTYTIYGGQSGLLWDMYFDADSETAVETFGVVFDHLNRTFKVTKRPDVTTPDKGFTMYVYTLDIKGNKKVAAYKVSLSSAVSGTATYAAVTHNLKSIATTNDASDDYFTLPISTMKEALGNNWTAWANSVDLTKTSVVAYAYSDLTGAVAEIGRYTTTTSGTTTTVVAPSSQASTGLGYYLLNSNNGITESVNSLNNIRIKVSSATTPTYTVDTQYYVKVTFKTAVGSYINHIVVPVTFTAPTVADQFALKSGYVVGGVVNAYYYDYAKDEEGVVTASNKVQLSHYFDKVDKDATISLDGTSTLMTLSNGTELKSKHLAKIETSVTITPEEGDPYDESRISDKIYLLAGVDEDGDDDDDDYIMTDGTNREFGYGKELVVKAWNATYDGWLYKTDAQKGYTFKIKLMSPIFEGTIKPVSGSTINVTANAEEGFAITKSMIELADYNKNTYSVVPDAEGDPTTVDVWSAAQIDKVEVDKDDNNTYIKAFSFREFKAATEDAEGQEGAIMVYADPLPNTQATSMDVIVTDCWGYVKTQEVSVTIKKN